MDTGHHMATREIPLAVPFEADRIPLGDRFDVLAVLGEYSLIRYEGIRCWKQTSAMEGACARLRPEIVASDGFHMMVPPQVSGSVFALPTG